MVKVFIADDQPHLTRLLKMMLTRAGHDIETFSHGKAVLDRLRGEAPDVLITDIEMPVMTGEELCLTIEREFPDRRYPIFVMTSRAESFHRNWTSKISNLTFMEKPVSPNKIASILEAYN